MADEIDRENDHAQKTEEYGIAAIRKAAADIPVGYGVWGCHYCEEESKRLVIIVSAHQSAAAFLVISCAIESEPLSLLVFVDLKTAQSEP